MRMQYSKLILILLSLLIQSCLFTSSLYSQDLGSQMDMDAEISVLGKGKVGGSVYIFLKYDFKHYDEIIVLSRVNSLGDFTSKKVVFDDKKIDNFFEKRNLKLGKRYVGDTTWNEATHSLRGELAMLCYDGTIVTAPFNLPVSDLILTPLDYTRWKIERGED